MNKKIFQTIAFVALALSTTIATTKAQETTCPWGQCPSPTSSGQCINCPPPNATQKETLKKLKE